MTDLLDDDDGGASGRKLFDFPRLKAELRRYYLLLAAFLGVFFVATVLMIALSEATYTATGVVGPADNSDQPFGLAAGGLASSFGGIAKHLHVGGMLGQNSDDKFNEYTSLLTSTRLASVLATKDHLLPEVFASQWDAAHGRWYPRDDMVSRALDYVRGLLRRPVKSAPDVDDLEKFFETTLNVDVSLETSFATVTFKFRDRAEAERILNLILLEADNIIREDKRRDVLARIGYLNSALENLTLADQKPAVIDILSQQQQEMMLIESDHRYASILIDPPHAPVRPTAPLPTVDVPVAMALACFVWLGAVRFTPQTGRWRRLLEAFARPRLGRRQYKASSIAKAGSTAPRLTA